jgi:hypothetical protein
MADDIEMEARRKSHIGFERESFLLLTPPAQSPLHRERPGQETNRKAGILKPAGRETKRSFQPRTAGLPSQIVDAAFSQTCCLHPLQHAASPPPVVADEPPVPEEEERDRPDHVDENETPHVASWQKSYFL